MILSVKPRKFILTLTFLNLTLMRKPKLLLNPPPLRVRRICLLMMQLLAMESQLLLKTKPNSLRVMPVSPRMLFKRMLKIPPLINNFFLWNCNYLGNSLLTYPKFVACKTFLLRALSNIYLFYFLSTFMTLNM